MPPTLIEIADEAFARRPLEATTFYNALHADGLRPCPPAAPAQVVSLLRIPAAEWVERDLDVLANHLLNGGAAVPAGDCAALADAISLRYAGLLAGGKRDRALRMKLQHANFLLREKIDRDLPVHAASRELGSSPPWDWLPVADGDLTIFSGPRSLHWRGRTGGTRAEVGLASQLDPLPDGSVSVGSIFSNGAARWQAGRIEFVPHDLPIVLICILPSGEFHVDYRGYVHRRGEAAPVARFPAGEISRARLIDGAIYAFDWSAPRLLWRMDPATWQADRITLPSILLGNDICARPGGGYYIIDKQQGYLFSLDEAFAVRERKLGFGRGDGRLFDPIALRLHQGEVCIVNWVSRSLVSLPVF